MDTCFLFTKYLDDTGCLFLKLSEDNALVSPPAFQTFAQIKEAQQDSKTLIVEPCENTTLIELELPWLSEIKARVAIPYALEDKLAQPIEELHFAFDKLRYQNKHYLVTVISKARIEHLMQILNNHNIEFDCITTDWFALPSQELLITDSVLLINTAEFKGALTDELAKTYLHNHPEIPTLVFEDSKLPSSLLKRQEHSTVWIAQSLLKSNPLNLCQGSMQHSNATDWIKKGYKVTAILGGVWLLSLLLVNAIALYVVNKKTETIDKQIEAIYLQFFPQAKQVVSPKFRITQLLANNNKGGNQAQIWFVLNQFTKAMQGKNLKVEQLRFQNKTLFVTLVSPDFASLEQFQTLLTNLQLKVKQTQASTREQQVLATLEIT